MPIFSRLYGPSSRDLHQVAQLYREAGWWEDAPSNLDMVAAIIGGSHCFIVARSEERIVAMGRAISDGVSDAYIQDVAVAAAHRHRGIARGLVDTLLTQLRADGLSWIGLIAERGTHGLYEPLGFRQMPNAAPMLLAEQKQK